MCVCLYFFIYVIWFIVYSYGIEELHVRFFAGKQSIMFYLNIPLSFPSLCPPLHRPRLKNIDRSSAQHLEVTVGDLTVIITDFKEKPKPSSTTTTTTTSTTSVSADHHNQSGSSSDNTERGVSRSSSPRGEASSVNGELH